MGLVVAEVTLVDSLIVLNNGIQILANSNTGATKVISAGGFIQNERQKRSSQKDKNLYKNIES